MSDELWLSVFAILWAMLAYFKADRPAPVVTNVSIPPQPLPEPEPKYLAPEVLWVPEGLYITVLVGGKLTQVSTHGSAALIYEAKGFEKLVEVHDAP